MLQDYLVKSLFFQKLPSILIVLCLLLFTSSFAFALSAPLPAQVQSSISQGSTFSYTYSIQAQPMDASYRTMVHFIDDSENIIVNDDHWVFEELSFTTDSAQFNGQLSYQRQVQLPASFTGKLRIRVGFYSYDGVNIGAPIPLDATHSPDLGSHHYLVGSVNVIVPTATNKPAPKHTTTQPTLANAGQSITYTLRYDASPLDNNYRTMVHFLDDSENIILNDDHFISQETGYSANTPSFNGDVSYSRTVNLPAHFSGNLRVITGFYELTNSGAGPRIELDQTYVSDIGDQRYQVSSLTVAPPPMPYTEGTLIKESDGTKIYKVESGKLRHIHDETSYCYYQSDYAIKYDVAVPSTTIASWNVFGETLKAPNHIYNCPSSSDLIKEACSEKVYLVQANTYQWIEDEYTFNQLGLDFNDVKTIAHQGINACSGTIGSNIKINPLDPVQNSQKPWEYKKQHIGVVIDPGHLLAGSDDQNSDNQQLSKKYIGRDCIDVDNLQGLTSRESIVLKPCGKAYYSNDAGEASTYTDGNRKYNDYHEAEGNSFFGRAVLEHLSDPSLQIATTSTRDLSTPLNTMSGYTQNGVIKLFAESARQSNKAFDWRHGALAHLVRNGFDGTKHQDLLVEDDINTRPPFSNPQSEPEDINIRFMYANKVQYEDPSKDYVFLSLHTNGREAAGIIDHSARGLLTLFYDGSATTSTTADDYNNAGLISAKTAFANFLHEEVGKTLTTNSLSTVESIKPRSDLAVIRRTRIPSALLELGYHTSPDDMRELLAYGPGVSNSPKQLVAAGIWNGIKKYFNAGVETVNAQSTPKTIFSTNDDIYVKGNGYPKNTQVRVFILPHKDYHSYAKGESLVNRAIHNTFATTDANGNLALTKIATVGQHIISTSKYDIVVAIYDPNNFSWVNAYATFQAIHLGGSSPPVSQNRISHPFTDLDNHDLNYKDVVIHANTPLYFPLEQDFIYDPSSEVDYCSNFKMCNHYRGNYNHEKEGSGSHAGIDIITPVGTAVYAMAKGVIVADDVGTQREVLSLDGNDVRTHCFGSSCGGGVCKGYNGGYGGMVIIRHDDITLHGNPVYSTYLHMKSFNPELSIGSTVYGGQFLGTLANDVYSSDNIGSGCSSDPHLHFQIDLKTSSYFPYTPGSNTHIADQGTLNDHTVNPLKFLNKFGYYLVDSTTSAALPVQNNDTNNNTGDHQQDNENDTLNTPTESQNFATDNTSIINKTLLNLNPSFSENLWYWWKWPASEDPIGVGEHISIHHDTQMFYSAPGSARVHIKSATSQGWEAQFDQGSYVENNISIQKNKSYQLDFIARANNSKVIEVLVANNLHPFESAGLFEVINLTSDWNHYSFIFNGSKDSMQSRIEFNLGGSTSTVWFDDVRLSAINTVTISPNHTTNVSPPINTTPYTFYNETGRSCLESLPLQINQTTQSVLANEQRKWYKVVLAEPSMLQFIFTPGQYSGYRFSVYNDCLTTPLFSETSSQGTFVKFFEVSPALGTYYVKVSDKHGFLHDDFSLKPQVLSLYSRPELELIDFKVIGKGVSNLSNTVEYTLKNHGTDYSGLFNVHGFANGKEFYSNNYGGIKSKHVLTNTINIESLPGLHNVTLSIDPNDNTKDTQKENNNITKELVFAEPVFDLRVSNLRVYNPEPYKDFSILFDVTNVGNVDQYNAIASAEMTHTGLGGKFVNNLKAGQTKVVSFSNRLYQKGWQNVTVFVKNNFIGGEANPHDNNISSAYYWNYPIDLISTLAWNLSCALEKPTITLYSGSARTHADVLSPFEVSTFKDLEQIDQWKIEKIITTAQNNYATKTIPFTFTKPNHTFKIISDSSFSIFETNEENNDYTYTLIAPECHFPTTQQNNSLENLTQNSSTVTVDPNNYTNDLLNSSQSLNLTNTSSQETLNTLTNLTIELTENLTQENSSQLSNLTNSTTEPAHNTTNITTIANPSFRNLSVPDGIEFFTEDSHSLMLKNESTTIIINNLSSFNINLSNAVLITKDLVAVDTQNKSSLANTSGMITFNNVSSAFSIYYSPDFTHNPAQLCPESICINITYSNGTVHITVAHYSSYMIGAPALPNNQKPSSSSRSSGGSSHRRPYYSPPIADKPAETMDSIKPSQPSRPTSKVKEQTEAAFVSEVDTATSANAAPIFLTNATLRQIPIKQDITLPLGIKIMLAVIALQILGIIIMYSQLKRYP